MAAEAPLARRNILEWRDRHKLAATLTLARCWQDLKPSINERVEDIGWYDAAVSPSAFIEKEVDPLLVDSIGSAIERLIADAQDDLRQIGEHQLSVNATVVNRRSIGTPYRRAKGTPLVLHRLIDVGRWFRAAGGVGRA